MSRLARWLLIGALAWLAGCTPSPPEGIRFALATLPANLNPLFASDAASERINRLLYQSLTDFDAQSRPLPALARWQQLASDHYRFELIGDNHFHDGTPLVAADVVATYRALLDPATASPHRGSFAHLRTVSASDERHIDFLLDRADPLFPGLLTIGILPHELLAAGHDFGADPIGSGPLLFVDRPAPGELRLRRRDDGQVIRFMHVPDPTVRTLKLIAGEVDLLQNDLPPELVRYLEGRADIRVSRGPGSTFSYIGFNLADPVTGDVRVRRAIAHAIDRAAIVHYLFHDGASLAESILPPDHWAGGGDLPATTFDPAQARAILATLGYGPDKPLKIVYKTSTDPFRLRVAAVFQAQLADVGIDLDIQSHDWGSFFGDIKAGRFQMYSLSWVGIRSPDILRYVFHSASLPPSGANRGRYRSAMVDALLDQAAVDADPALFRQVQQQVHDDLVYVPLWYEGNVLLSRADIHGYRLRRDGAYDGLITVKRVATP